VSAPRVVVTGAAGFVGRHLLDVLKAGYRIVAVDLHSPARSGAPVHENIEWHEADLAEPQSADAVFARVAATGGADFVVHLAAYYDYESGTDAQYERANVVALRNVLEACARLTLRRFVFSSSLAACRLAPGRVLNEDSAADGDHVYARTKREGERMVAGCAGRVPATIVRFAALFSDWCEFPPLFALLRDWLSRSWTSRVLAGRGNTALPYLHVDDATHLLATLLDGVRDVPPGEVLLASPDGSTSHREIFDAATLLYFGRRRRPLHVPRPLCGPGIAARQLLGALAGQRPFERTWMARYVDTRMTVDARRTRERLGWAPRPRLELLRRLPFQLENLKLDPHEWARRNQARIEPRPVMGHLAVHALLDAHQDEITHEFTAALRGPDGSARFPSYQQLTLAEHEWYHRLLLRHLLTAVRTRDASVFAAYCHDIAEHRWQQGYRSQEVCAALEELNRICFKILRRDPASNALRQHLQDYVTMTLRIGCDRAQETLERLEATARHRLRDGTDAELEPSDRGRAR
jgi:nucleoside-diphosphate-sugar epimerase